MNVTDSDVNNVRRISEQVFGDKEYIELDAVKHSGNNVSVSVEAAEEKSLGTRNAFAGQNLKKYIDSGYVAVAVGGGDETHAAWFERADAVEFGDVEPEGEYDLFDGWSVSIGAEYAVIHHEDTVVSHVGRDGWTLDEYVLSRVLPAKVTDRLEAIGFEKGNVADDE
jgi:hypothetical protein